MAATTPSATATALFAGGCFWCMQPAFDCAPGVSATQVGYTGGAASTATYEQVSRGDTGHVEAIQVTYDPAQVTYAHLLKTYLENIDPTDGEGQFADRGTHYMPAIYYADTTQQQTAEQALAAIAPKFAPQPISVKLLPASAFYVAEAYHQKYYEKNATHYNAYKVGSGRASYLENTWKKNHKDTRN